MCVVHLYEAAGLLLCNNCVLKFQKKYTNIFTMNIIKLLKEYYRMPMSRARNKMGFSRVEAQFYLFSEKFECV